MLLSTPQTPADRLSDKVKLGLLWLIMMSSGLVLREPAPYDALILALMMLSAFTGFRVPRGLGLPATLLMIFVMFDFIGVMSSVKEGLSRTHVLVTLYLSLTALFFASLMARDNLRMLRIIFTGYAAGATITALAGIAGYFGGIEIFTLYGRAKGMFKDPNVFGPFLIPAALYAMLMLMKFPLKRAWIWVVPLGIIILGLLLSFSRAAWGNFLVSSLLLIVMVYNLTATPVIRKRILVYCVSGLALGSALLLFILSQKSVGTLFAERFAIVQSYDVAENGGRFHGWLVALGIILLAPFGVGPTSFGFIYGNDPHNVYLHTTLSAGWIGGLAYLMLILITVYRGYRFLFLDTPVRELFFVCYAAFVPLVIEGIIIDSEHWRHFFVLLGLIWGMMVVHDRRARALPLLYPHISSRSKSRMAMENE